MALYHPAPAQPARDAMGSRLAEPVAPIQRQHDGPPVTPPALKPADEAWVDATLAAMTLDQKLGQLIMPRWHPDSAEENVSQYHVGGFVFLANPSERILDATTTLQAMADVPLLFSIDCEAGAGARVRDATVFPINMGLAAGGRADLAFQQGVITARECRAMGIHIGFGPVVDTNTEPVNPIIGIRSYGDDTAQIERFAAAYVAGASSAGMLCTLKHYPGHGPTTGDSHHSLPFVELPCDELEERHIRPYRALVGETDVDLVMTAHCWYPCLDPGDTPWPATLSRAALTDVLRDDIGFEGVIISDAYNMRGLREATTLHEGARLGILAGLDIILMPIDVEGVVSSLRDAVAEGLIPESRIDESVRRILRLKSRVGLDDGTGYGSPEALAATLQHPEHLAVTAAIGETTIASARVNAAEFPITDGQSVLVVRLAPTGSIFYSHPTTTFVERLAELLPNSRLIQESAPTAVGRVARHRIVSEAANVDRIVVVSSMWTPIDPPNQRALVDALRRTGKPVAYLSFGSPYRAQQYENLANYYCGFSSHHDTQRAMASVLTGKASATASWPVRVMVDIGPRGDGE